ncbi:TIGR03557 family F420-dependent LLM class oxidoreductase [Salsipaludibacter albus]|uniref:TIGR03557 family F420-dependent LLM class oxidoreductase n=1 Tax=Salsipaludibacter albus TaxID=2849650 RepID=UPI001EE3F4B3|nr:TIGR03557 family F420-dependent LLM class oxidoreductase [Salsipaludibacter albus]MBY5161397.1 TIGR03557 family F420-dependent LLM class oxidoreductase [Salsipaludibacter albus]
MARYGFTLFSELNGPRAMLDQARAAEEGGFDFLGMSDHFHPWLSRHTDSPFAWSALGAVAAATESIDLVTLVTCPTVRYHPALIAQAAATVALISDGRFTLGLGAGENLSEHVVGRGWPPVDVRHEMLAEAIQIIRALWTGEWTTFRGEHLTVEDARLHTLPDELPRIGVAGSGPAALEILREHGDELITDGPDPDVVEQFRDVRPDGTVWTQVPMAWDPDHDVALDHAHNFAFSAPGWKVMAELPNIPGFDAVADLVDDDMVQDLVLTGDDPAPVIDTITRAVESGHDNVAVVQVGPQRTEEFQRWWGEEVRPHLP